METKPWPVQIVEQAADAVGAATGLPCLLRPLATDQEGVCLRGLAAAPADVYMDGEERVVWTVQAWCRRRREDEAIDLACLASMALQRAMAHAHGPNWFVDSAYQSTAPTLTETPGELFTYTTAVSCSLTVQPTF
mgnify:FL=1